MADGQRIGQHFLARVTACVLAVTFVAFVSWVVFQLCGLDRGMEDTKLTSEAAILASTLFFDKMTALAQVTIGLLGASWAFLILAEARIAIVDWATTACLVLANLSFLISLYVYAAGYDFIVVRLFHHGAFDIDAPFVVFTNRWQQLPFVFGCLSLAATILFGRSKT